MSNLYAWVSVCIYIAIKDVGNELALRMSQCLYTDIREVGNELPLRMSQCLYIYYHQGRW